MFKKFARWFALVSVIIAGLFGVGLYVTFVSVLVSFLIGVLTILYLKYDETQIFREDINCLDDPLHQSNFYAPIPQVLSLFELQQTQTPQKFDSRITGSETVDSFLNEIIQIIIDDYVTPWYSMITSNDTFTTHCIKKVVVTAGANISNRVKSVDWISLLATRFPEEFTKHLKLYKQSRVRLKQVRLLSEKEVTNGSRMSPKKGEERKLHKRNKSETDLSWPPDSATYGKSKFYDNNAETTGGNTLTDLFFDLECAKENKKICRDIFCVDSENEYALLSEVAEMVLYLVAPEETFKCHALKMILIELVTSAVLRPLVDLLTNPDNINRAIIRMCCKEVSLPSEMFLTVVRCNSNAEELEATLELVLKDIQKLHSKDSAGEWDIQERQKLSSLEYLARVIQARRATLGPQEGLCTAGGGRVPEEVARSLKFLSESTAWRSNAQYCVDIEYNELDPSPPSKSTLDSLRSSALELCDSYLAPGRPGLRGLPPAAHAELVRRITSDEGFSTSPVGVFDDLQRSIYEALEEDPSWQSDYMLENDQDNGSNSDIKIEEKNDTKKYGADMLTVPVNSSRHNRSRSDIVGNKMTNECLVGSNLSSANSSSLSLSHSALAQKPVSPLKACIIETALVQEKGKAFGIYAVAVTRPSDGEVWHIYRRYSDFHDLHATVKEKWPELSQLPFPAKKTFQNTSRSVLESRKRRLNEYLSALATLAAEPRYAALWTREYLCGFLSAETTAERHTNSFDALFVNPLRAGMRTLKNMPDQLANTVDGVMDGISKVFQGKSDSNYDITANSSATEIQDDDDESPPLKLLEEILGIRGLWLRRRLLAPVRTLIADRVNKKVLELVSSLTSPGNIVQYLKNFKQLLRGRGAPDGPRAAAVRARTRLAAKVALLCACADDLRHMGGADSTRRGLLALVDMLQTQAVNKRILLVFMELTLANLFPDNNVGELFRRLYSTSPRVPSSKKQVFV